MIRRLTALAALLLAVLLLATPATSFAFTDILDLSNAAGNITVSGTNVNLDATLSTFVTDTTAYYNVVDNPDELFDFQLTANIVSGSLGGTVVLGATTTLNQLMTSPGVQITSVSGTGTFGLFTPSLIQMYISDIYLPDPDSITFHILMQDPLFAALSGSSTPIDGSTAGAVAVASAVPLPGAAWLTLLGLSALGARAKRRR